jgi:hypothetical protein
MKQILFLATILISFVTPVCAQKFACSDMDYDCLINQYSNAIKANPDNTSLKRAVNYFAKDKRTFLYLDAMSHSLSKGIIARQATISKYESFFLTEEFSFLIQDFKMNHQSAINNLNIKVRYSYENGIAESKYPDFRAILKDIEDFLNNYPNKVDYWEILNKNLTLLVLKKYPMLSSITSEIQVSSSQLVPYLRSSIVTRNQSKRIRTKK